MTRKSSHFGILLEPDENMATRPHSKYNCFVLGCVHVNITGLEETEPV